MDLVNPGLLGSRETFERTFARPIELRRDTHALERLALSSARSSSAARRTPRGRARPASDHDREGAVPPHRRTGEPLSRDGGPLDAADRRARASLRPARCRARDARPAEAGLQPPEARPSQRPPARGRVGKARAARRDPRGGSRRRQDARVHPVPGLRPARSRTSRTGSAARSVLPRLSAARARSCWPGSTTSRPASSSSRSRRRSRAEPLRRRTTSSLRPLVEPGRRAAGDGPRPPASASASTSTSRASSARQPSRSGSTSSSSQAELAERVIAAPADDWLAELDLDTIRAAVALAPRATERPA